MVIVNYSAPRGPAAPQAPQAAVTVGWKERSRSTRVVSARVEMTSPEGKQLRGWNWKLHYETNKKKQKIGLYLSSKKGSIELMVIITSVKRVTGIKGLSRWGTGKKGTIISAGHYSPTATDLVPLYLSCIQA